MAVELVNRRGVSVGRLPAPNIPAPAPVVQVATPKATAPAEAVRPIRPEQSELGQIANSLGFFNENLFSLGSVYTRISNKENLEQGQQMAMEDMAKARQITKLGFKKASEQGLIDPGANPYMRLGLYETTGKIAGQEYREALLNRRDEVNSPYSKITEDQLIAQERQKFAEQVGENFYAQQGFLSEANQAEQSFKNAVIGEKAKFTQAVTEEKDALANSKIVSSLSKATTPEDKANALTSLMELYNNRSQYAPNVNALTARDVGNAIRSIAKDDPTKAQQVLDEVTTMVVSRRDGSTASFGEILTPVVDDLQNIIDSSLDKEERNWERSQRRENFRANVEIDSNIKKFVDSGANLLDDAIVPSIVAEVMKTNPNADIASVTQTTREKMAQVSAPDQQQAVNYAYELAKTNPDEAIQFVSDAEGKTISWEASQQLKQAFAKSNDNLQLINSPASNSYYKLLSDGFPNNLMFESMTEAEQEAFVLNSRAVFDSNVASYIESLDPAMPNTEVNKLLRQELPKITEKTKNDLFKVQNQKALETQAYLSPRLKNEIKTGATDPKVNPVAEWKLASLIFPNTNPNPNEILLSRWGRLEQLQNQLDVTAQGTKIPEFRPEQALREQSELKQFMSNKSQNYLTQLSKLINAGGVEVADMFGDDRNSEFYTFTPEQTEKYNADYLKIKSRMGFSSTELSSGVTSDGIKFDPKTLSTDGTLFFKSTAERVKAWEDYRNAVRTDANGFTTFEGSAQGYYIQTLIDLYGLKDEDSLNNFIANQKLKLELLGK
jgi:hypothetical protein